MDFHVAIIGPDNSHLLSQVAEGVFDTPVEGPHLPAYVGDPSQRLLVAIADGVVIGQIKSVLHRHPEKAPGMFIEELGVATDHRRQGIATALMKAAIALARDMGCAELWLATEPENEAANAFYKATGMGGLHVVMYSRQL